MPTARGWLVAATGFFLCVASRMFGAEALGQVGLALIVLVIGALVVVRLGRHELVVTRRVAPDRAPAETLVTATLELGNSGLGAAPLVLLEDRLPAVLRTRARFAFSGVEPRGRREASYKLRPSRRGRFEIGPVEMTCVDPFALARVRRVTGGTANLLVYPKIDQLVLPRDLGERRSLSVSALRSPTGATGEDFYTLREYVEGDDLRKIHWPSTAKRQRYMIRQEETPWHNRATIVLDDRALVYEGEAFERAVEAAASLVDLYHRSGFTYRLTGAHHPGAAANRGSNHRAACLDDLATITKRSLGSGPDPLLVARFAELEARAGAEGTLVVISGDLEPDAALAMSRCRRRFKQVIAITFPSHRFGPGSTKSRWDGEKKTMEVVQLLARSGVRAIVVGPGEPLRTAWGSLSRVTTGGENSWDRKPEPV
ncbi:MAG: hypothetical protein QOG04_1276 [Actinomycetota bacterium]|jgi:uncharacterized protein (DUF58 family)|nr:hypothetical protein [Actinomycetota bacterium]